MSNRAHNLQTFGRKLARIQWHVCVWCGLLALRNARTAALLRAPCPGKDYD